MNSTMFVKKVLFSVENRITKLSDRKFCFILVLAVFIKNGLHPIGPDWLNSLYIASSRFPEYYSYFSSSMLPIFIVKILNYPPYIVWWIASGLFSLVVFAQVFWFLNKTYKDDFKKVTLVFLTLPLFISPFLYIGHYDQFTILAALIVFQVKNNLFIFLAALIASLANPEQALATSLCLLFIFLAVRDKITKIIFLSWLFCSTLVLLLLNNLFGRAEHNRRSNVIIGEVTQVLSSSLGLLNLIIFSLFGVAWILIIYKFWTNYNTHLLIGAVFIPLLLSVFILDHTRVGVAVGALPLLLLIRFLFSSTPLLKFRLRFFYVYFLVYMFIPTIFVDFDNTIRLPYQELVKFLLQFNV